MDKLNIVELVEQTREVFVEHGYAAKSIRNKDRAFMEILRLHFRSGSGFYCPAVVAEFLANVEERFQSGRMSKIYYRHLLKTASYLGEYNETRELRLAHQTPSSISNHYNLLLDEIRVHGGWNTKSNDYYWAVARTFFNWLKSNGYDFLGSVNEGIVKEYLIDCVSRLSGHSIDSVSRTLKPEFDKLHSKEPFAI